MSHRVAVYARISEDRSGSGAGVARQVEDCLQLAKERGLNVVRVFEENDTSAYGRVPRPRWRELITMAERGEIDGIVAWHPDRLYRRLTDLEEVVDLVKTTRVNIFTVKAGDMDLSTSTGITIAGIVASIASGEVRRMGERIARAHEAKAKEGQWKGGRRPWGYTEDGVQVHPVEAEALRRAADLILSGRTIAEAARLVKEMTGREIARTTLRDVLTSYRIVGQRSYLPQTERDRRRRLSPDHPDAAKLSEPLVFLAVWPAILDMETWSALRSKFNRVEQKAGRAPRPRKNMLAGLLACGKCANERADDGTPVTSVLQANAKAYVCQRCGQVSINKAPIEQLIIEKVTERLRTAPKALLADGPSASRDWTSEIEKIEGREKDLTIAYTEGLLTLEGYRDGLAMLREKRGQITDEEEAYHRRVIEARRRADLLPVWLEAEPLDKREVIQAVAEYFLVEPTGKTGRRFDPSRVSAKWRDDDRGHERLGAALTPEELRERRLEQQKRYNAKRKAKREEEAAAKRPKNYRG